MKWFNNPQTIEELVTLPGVGRKTANIVTNHGFHKAYGIAVDTHVKRLSQRLGFTSLVPDDASYAPMALGALTDGITVQRGS